ncbi:alpha/beta hydrolase [Planomonospora sp. ID67723]|uniref:alpha/beta fold hydrolase n=1 Tax=Planomonospora sp. ID67723 TaxID=2738134 RepID=UPI0018C35BD2|nr:alpha/beta hydrolase [Planomonospora sp. ID67723]MBG0829081.1 alpha/beta hydrolase [Planomonospora sp. ID67723]
MPLDETAVSVREGKRRPLRTAAGAFAALLAVLLATTATTATAATGARSPERPVVEEPVSSLPGFRHGKVAVDGGAVHYVRGGSGPAVLLLHGWPQTWAMWRDVMPALAREHTVIAMDLPGLGASGIPAGGYDKVTTAHRIRQAVNRLGFRQVGIVGHDVGALVAYPYARDFPAEVTRVAMLETPLSGFGLEELYGLSWHFRFNSSPSPIPEQIMDNDEVGTYLGMIFDFSHRREAVDRETYFRAYADPARRTAGYEYYRAFAADAENNKANASRRLAMPVLGMGGQYAFGSGVAESFRQVADDVRTVVVPESGHFIPEENPSFLAGCLNFFLGAQRPAPSPELTACAP